MVGLKISNNLMMANIEEKHVVVDRFVSHPWQYTGRFIMYSGFTKIYYSKTAGHVFTKPVQTE